MGRYVKITGYPGPGRYAARHELSNEVFYATVDKKFRNKFDPLDRDTPPKWCPFLMDKDEDERYMCSIFESAPSFCRDYKCCTCRIFSSDGSPVASVKGRSTIVTGDAELENLWDSAVNSVLNLNLNQQKQKIAEIIEGYGYNVRYFDK